MPDPSAWGVHQVQGSDLRRHAATLRTLGEDTWADIRRRLAGVDLPAAALGDAAAGTDLPAAYAALLADHEDLAVAAVPTLTALADLLDRVAGGYAATDALRSRRVAAR